MTFSILIAAYQAERFMDSALEGIRGQNHTDWELIVVEDGSDDGTQAKVERFASSVSQNVVYDNLGFNQGVAAARNRLLDLSRGDAVAFLDADDLWYPEHLSSLAQSLAEGHALACTPIVVWDGDRSRQIEIHSPTPVQIAEPRLGLFKTSFIWTSTCVALPRETIERVGRFDPSLRIGEDRDYWFRSLAGGLTLGCTSVPTCRYTKHSGSSMTRTQRVAADTVAFYEKHRSVTDIPTRLRQFHLAEVLTIQGRLLKATDKDSAHQLLGRSLSLHPWQPIALAAWLQTL